MKIIIAEDDPVSRHFLKMTLKYWGHKIIAVTDGVEAWESIEDMGNPDILISDWEMPNLTGIELCSRIREDPDRSDIYVVLLTAKNLKKDMYNGFKMGADDYVAKPVTEQDLRQAINKGINFHKDDVTDKDAMRRKNIEDFIARHNLDME